MENENSNSSDEDKPQCPICNKEYQNEDIKYHLICNTKQCQFNMCYDCTKNLLQSVSKPEEASDGNVYTLNLKCPSCRDGFCVPLQDILLLRECYRESDLLDMNDSELSAAQLRKKYDVERYKKRDEAAKTFHDGVILMMPSIDSIDSSGTEENYSDVHHIDPKEEVTKMKMKKMKMKKMNFVNSMMFCGLSSSMTESERIFVKELMTSGSTMKLMQAAYILASIIDMNRRGGTPLMRKANEHKNGNHLPVSVEKTRSEGPGNRTGRISMHTGGSHIQYQSRYKSYDDKINQKYIRSTKGMAPSLSVPLQIHQTEFQKDTFNRGRWKRLYPVPIRMPKAITLRLDFDLNNRWRCPFSFVDDEESFNNLRQKSMDSNNIGDIANYNERNVSMDVRSNLVRDAFQELKVSMSGTSIIKKTLNQNIATGVENILALINDDESQVELPSIIIPWRRVVVTSAKGDVWKSGIKPGDVITHFDGEPFDGNAEKLKHLLLLKQEYSNENEVPSCQIVVNAEVGVAEALRIRNLVAESEFD